MKNIDQVRKENIEYANLYLDYLTYKISQKEEHTKYRRHRKRSIKYDLKNGVPFLINNGVSNAALDHFNEYLSEYRKDIKLVTQKHLDRWGELYFYDIDTQHSTYFFIDGWHNTVTLESGYKVVDKNNKTIQDKDLWMQDNSKDAECFAMIDIIERIKNNKMKNVAIVTDYDNFESIAKKTYSSLKLIERDMHLNKVAEKFDEIRYLGTKVYWVPRLYNKADKNFKLD